MDSEPDRVRATSGRRSNGRNQEPASDDGESLLRSHPIITSFHNLLRVAAPRLLMHEHNVGFMAGRLALEIGYTKHAAAEIEAAAALHDIGHLAIPESIMLKAEPLSPEEWAVIRQHPDLGATILSGQSSKLLKLAARIAATHHAAFDGTGYPALRGADIPLEARIVAVCDVYDALRDAHAYRHSLPHERVLEIMAEGDGRTGPGKFDPDVLAAFLRIAERFRLVRE